MAFLSLLICMYYTWLIYTGGRDTEEKTQKENLCMCSSLSLMSSIFLDVISFCQIETREKIRSLTLMYALTHFLGPACQRGSWIIDQPQWMHFNWYLELWTGSGYLSETKGRENVFRCMLSLRLLFSWFSAHLSAVQALSWLSRVEDVVDKTHCTLNLIP